MAVGDARVSRLSHTSTNTTFFSKPPITFLTCFCRDERQKFVGKKDRLHVDSNSQPPALLNFAHWSHVSGRNHDVCMNYIASTEHDEGMRHDA